MPVIDNLPYHQSEACFRRYEHFILSSVLRHPEPITIVGFAELSLNTFIARLRDARASHKKHNWPSKIPREEFLSSYNDIKVWLKDGKVLMGTKAAVNIVLPSEQPKLSAETFRIGTVNKHQLSLLVRLADGHTLSRPIEFIYRFEGREFETLLEKNDIDIEGSGENTYILT